ncbi:hypothetical protein CY0110_16062 [Crocosphaera chwakensis CCY0110]|uniref:Uncharacterized protein n=1 Tax=Crocosphaera chwakensis CCY0110 TaxID=391612 RepID=A3IHP4_9CHRO|nr:hypothetical protein CY0110_16062 [Crocosphaera chwakensis CCY0110]
MKVKSSPKFPTKLLHTSTTLSPTASNSVKL